MHTASCHCHSTNLFCYLLWYNLCHNCTCSVLLWPYMVLSTAGCWVFPVQMGSAGVPASCGVGRHCRSHHKLKVSSETNMVTLQVTSILVACLLSWKLMSITRYALFKFTTSLTQNGLICLVTKNLWDSCEPDSLKCVQCCTIQCSCTQWALPPCVAAEHAYSPGRDQLSMRFDRHCDHFLCHVVIRFLVSVATDALWVVKALGCDGRELL